MRVASCAAQFSAVIHMSRSSVMPRIYIGRLSHRARERDVERFFKGFGKIVEVDLKNG